MEKVDVLMSIYKPNKEYLYKQLDSIKNQTYKNIELIIFDDCIEERFDQKLIVNRMQGGNVKLRFLPYKEQNLGYAKAFAYLVEESDGDFIAFSDQDDIWDLKKIEVCVATMKKDKCLVASHGKTIIDKEDQIVKNGKSKAISKKRATWKSGDDIAKYQLFRDFVAGNCMMANGPFARSTMPISEYAPHDSWIVSCAAIEGKISRIPMALTYYRRHEKNVSGVLGGIESKQQYYDTRVKVNHEIVKDILKKYPNFRDRNEVWKFSNARVQKKVFTLLKMSYLSPEKAKFESLLAVTPEFLFCALVKIVQRI